MKTKAEVVVIGGGINGCTIAYNLAKAGIDTILFEKGCLGSGATGRCGGIVWVEHETKEFMKLAVRSLKRFTELEMELDYDLEYNQAGQLDLAVSEEERENYEEEIEFLKSLGVNVRWMEKSEIKEMVPEFDVDGIGAVGALWIQVDANFNPFHVLEALARNAEELGAKICTHTKVKDIEVRNEEVENVLTSTGKIKTDIVVNAAGGWSRDVAKMAGVEIPTEPIPQFAAQACVTEPLKHFLDPMIASSDIWFHQTENGEIIGGSGKYVSPVSPPPEEEPEYTVDARLDFIREYSKTLGEYIPRLRSVNILRHWGGFFDVTPDARPILGEVDEVRGLILACGCSAHGFCLSQAIGEFISDLIVKREVSMPEIMKSLNLRRFRRESQG